MRLLNASATENVVLALPGHRFQIIAMDGNPVPNPQSVEVISLAVAERVDAIVEMNAPGVWILGSTLEKSRQMGLGIVVEYAGKSGSPTWKDPTSSEWDYTEFAGVGEAPEARRYIRPYLPRFGPQNGSQFDTWTINNKSWPDTEPMRCRQENGTAWSSATPAATSIRCICTGIPLKSLASARNQLAGFAKM